VPRRFAAEALCSWGLGDIVDDAMLVVSELATNAVIHAGTEYTVTLSLNGNELRIAVADGSAVQLQPRDADLATPGGRGLGLVTAVASGWDATPAAGGKVVSVALAAD
jgi:anti-sigma regulatory factor (Ser/Thr protein kinase)